MIVSMKKVHVVVQKKDVPSTLKSLRRLGTVHIEHQEPLSGETLQQYREDVEGIARAIELLDLHSDGQKLIPKDAEDGVAIVRKILDLAAEAEREQEHMHKRQAVVRQWEVWGDFDPKAFEELSGRGVHLHLCTVPQDKKDQLPEGVILETIFTANGIDHGVAITREEMELPFEVIKPPVESIAKMRCLQEEGQKKVDAIHTQIMGLSCYSDFLKKTLQEHEDLLRFEEAERGIHIEEELAVLKGFAPADRSEDIQKKAKKEHWGVLMEEPAEDDRVPTLIRNPKWVNLIKPVFDFIDIAPGYKEYDISLFFLLFLSIFVGILIGDAGYGILFLGLMGWVHLKNKNKIKDPMPFYLAYVFIGCIIAWGVLTGTFFGQKWLAETPVQALLPWLKENANVQLFCFTLGAIHLSIAHIWRTIQKFPSAAFLSDVGWLAILWGMFAMARVLILGAIISPIALNMLIGGSVLVVFFTKPNSNPLKAIGPGLGDLALNVVNTFTDIVSYIRLFAVGLATVAVADATNTMAGEIGGVGAVIVLLLGHVINIVLALMAILVHGLRLNVLEFSGHLNMEWGGFRYAPFKKTENA